MFVTWLATQYFPNHIGLSAGTRKFAINLVVARRNSSWLPLHCIRRHSVWLLLRRPVLLYFRRSFCIFGMDSICRSEEGDRQIALNLSKEPPLKSARIFAQVDPIRTSDRWRELRFALNQCAYRLKAFNIPERTPSRSWTALAGLCGSLLPPGPPQICGGTCFCRTG
jgi:hypothetical protein